VDVKEFISKCKTCQPNKPGTQKPYLYSIPDIPHTPNKKISIDIMEPFEITNKGNRYILVIQDYLTRYIVEPLMRQINGVDHQSTIVFLAQIF